MCRYLQSRVGLFCNLRPAAVHHLAAHATLQTFPEGSVICQQGDGMHVAMALLSGSAHAFRRRDRTRGGSRMDGGVRYTGEGGAPWVYPAGCTVLYS